MGIGDFGTKVSAVRSMLCGGVIIEVSNLEQAVLAEHAGARCVLVRSSLADDSCTTYNNVVMEIANQLSIPVMARARIGHTHEADALGSIGCQFIDERELLNVADEDKFLNKYELRIPCVCGSQNLGEALRRVGEGAAMIRIQGETFGETVKNLRLMWNAVGKLRCMNEDALREFSTRISAPLYRLREAKVLERLPVPTFAGGGIATVDDVLLLMELGCDGVFVGSEIFDTKHPYLEIKSMIRCLTPTETDPKVIGR